MAVPLGKAAEESGPTYFCYLYNPEVSAPDTDCRSVNTSSGYGNRTALQTVIIPCHHLGKSKSPPQICPSLFVSCQLHGMKACPLAQPHTYCDWTKAKRRSIQVVCVQSAVTRGLCAHPELAVTSHGNHGSKARDRVI